jgi:hypothetical protein
MAETAATVDSTTEETLTAIMEYLNFFSVNGAGRIKIT